MLRVAISKLPAFWDSYRYHVLLWAGIKFLFLAIAFIVFPLIPIERTFYDMQAFHFEKRGDLVEHLFAPFDAQIYLNIAVNGYSSEYVFFPLYPLAIALFSFVTAGNPYIAGMLVTTIASFVGFLLFVALMRRDFEERAVKKAALLFLLFPGTIFFSVIYTDALFFCLAVGTFYAARKHAWLTAGFLAFLGALTRPVGILLCLPLAIEYCFYLKKNRTASLGALLRGIPIVALAPLGTLTFFLFTWIKTGDFFLFFHKEVEGWSRTMPSLFSALGILAERVAQWPQLPFHGFAYSRLDVIVTILFLGSILFMIKTLRQSYWIYALLLVLLPTSTGQLLSMVRFSAVSFPHFILLGTVFQRSRILFFVTVGMFFLLSVILLIRFTHWYWAG